MAMEFSVWDDAAGWLMDMPIGERVHWGDEWPTRRRLKRWYYWEVQRKVTTMEVPVHVIWAYVEWKGATVLD